MVRLPTPTALTIAASFGHFTRTPTLKNSSHLYSSIVAICQWLLRTCLSNPSIVRSVRTHHRILCQPSYFVFNWSIAQNWLCVALFFFLRCTLRADPVGSLGGVHVFLLSAQRGSSNKTWASIDFRLWRAFGNSFRLLRRALLEKSLTSTVSNALINIRNHLLPPTSPQ